MTARHRNSSKRDVAAVVGAGAWGTTLAALQSDNFARVYLFTPEGEVVEELVRFGSNSAYLPGVRVPRNVFATASWERALAEASDVIVAVPSAASRQVAREVLAVIGRGTRVVLATKGMELGSGLLSIEVWRQEIARAEGPHRARHRDPLVLSGPNLASEISRGLPAVSCLAGVEASRVSAGIDMLEHPLLTLVPCADPLGAQAAGALKNVYAIGCGMGSALGWGDNAMAAIVWRGLEETSRFAQAIGGEASVALTPAGTGDFLATCTSPLSRNHDLGRMVSGACEGHDEVRGVREGAQTASEALRRARGMGVAMPLLEAVSSVLDGIRKPEAVLAAACGTPRRAPSPICDDLSQPEAARARSRLGGVGGKLEVAPE